MSTVIGLSFCKTTDRLHVRAPRATPEVLEFLRTLPNVRQPRHDKLTRAPKPCAKCGIERAWNCEPTPAAVWRLLNECPATVEAPEEVRRVALAHIPKPNAADALSRDDQPERITTSLWRHQLAGYHFLASAGRRSGMLDYGMGTGKSKILVDLVVNKGWKKNLILCPCSVRGVWRREFEKWAAKPVEVLVLDGSQTAAKKAGLAREFLRRQDRLGNQAVVVVNYETAFRGKMAELLLEQQWDLVAGDESHRFKNPETSTASFMAKLARKATFRLCLTGTPMAHSPLDVFGQMLFLDPGVFGTAFFRFRDRYAVTVDNGFGPQIVDYKNRGEFTEKLSHLVLSRSMDDTDIELPDAVDQVIDTPLPKEARRPYDELEEDLVAEIGDSHVIARNVLVKLLRLQQITSGSVPTENDEPGELTKLHTAKQDALRELLENLAENEKVVVFCQFRQDLVAIREVAEKLGRSYGELSGTSRDLTENAQIPERVNVLGAQIQSGGTGVDLTAARYCVYYSLGASLSNYLQSRKRTHRPGQTRTVFYYHLVAPETVDVKVYRALAKRQDVIEEFVRGIRAAESAA